MVSGTKIRTNDIQITEQIQAVYGDGDAYQTASIELSEVGLKASQISNYSTNAKQRMLQDNNDDGFAFRNNRSNSMSNSLSNSHNRKVMFFGEFSSSQNKRQLQANNKLDQDIADIEQGMKLAEFPEMEYMPSDAIIFQTNLEAAAKIDEHFEAMVMPSKKAVSGQSKNSAAKSRVSKKRGTRKMSITMHIAEPGTTVAAIADEFNQGILKNIRDSTKESLHTQSSISMEDYFTQDIERRQEEQFKRVLNDITRFKSYFVKFRFKIFAEFFFYHFLFIMFFGPLCNPILYWFGKGLPRNLMFWGMSPSFFIQTASYIAQTFTICLYASLPTPFVKFESEIIYLVVGMIYRLSIIGTKYATFDPTKIRAIKHQVFDPKELQQDFFLGDWRDQTNRRAYEIDPSWFYLEFIVSPEKDTVETLENNNKILSEFYRKSESSFEPEPIHTQSPGNKPFFVYGVVKLLVDTFQKKHAFAIALAKNIGKTYALIRVLIPSIYKIVEFGNGFFVDQHWYEWVISISIAYTSFLFFYFTIWTLLQGVIDLRRKIYFMEQMAFMISPRKLRNIDSEKLLPTINIFKSSNLKAWQLMRHVCQEYGKRYEIRVQTYFSGIVLEALVSIVVLSLQYAEVIRLESCFMYTLLLETVCSLIFLVLIMYYGAQVNEMFEIHDGILNQNKSVLLDIYRMRRRYFCQEFKTTNYLYSKAISKIKEEVLMLRLENPCAHIKEIVDSYDTHIDELKFDKQQNPFKIGSFIITNGMLESGVIGVASIIIAVVSQYLSSKFSNAN